MKGILFNMGMLVHDYTQYLETKSSINKLKDMYASIKGPVVGLINVSNTRLYNKKLKLKKNDFYKFVTFINKELPIIEKDDSNIIDIESIIK